MKRLISLASLLLLTSVAATAADAPVDPQAEMRKMQEAQARLMVAMMAEKKSRLGFNETVAALQAAAKKRGWEVGPVVNMQDAMLKAGHPSARPFTMLALCKRDLAENLLKAQAAQKTMPFAPCRFSVFEGTDGKIYIAKANTEFMAQMATPVFEPMLKQLADEEKALLAGIIE
jgi:uncharacterized protein (DUF302 family)